MRLALVCFYCLCVFVYLLYFIATVSFAGYFLPVLFCMLSMLISDSRSDLVWFRLSCDHGWIRSGSVNVRKQQQQQRSPLSVPTTTGGGVYCPQLLGCIISIICNLPSYNNVQIDQEGHKRHQVQGMAIRKQRGFNSKSYFALQKLPH